MLSNSLGVRLHGSLVFWERSLFLLALHHWGRLRSLSFLVSLFLFGSSLFLGSRSLSCLFFLGFFGLHFTQFLLLLSQLLLELLLLGLLVNLLLAEGLVGVGIIPHSGGVGCDIVHVQVVLRELEKGGFLVQRSIHFIESQPIHLFVLPVLSC